MISKPLVLGIVALTFGVGLQVAVADDIDVCRWQHGLRLDARGTALV